MASRLPVLLLAALALGGCEKLTGGSVDPKVLDAEAVGYACRVSQKEPEPCMKENEAQSPASVLNGWKKADSEIRERVIDVTMSNPPPLPASAVQPADAEADNPDEATDKGDEKKSSKDGKSDKADKEEKSTKDGKSAKDEKSDKGDKSSKNDKAEKSDKADKSEKSDTKKH